MENIKELIECARFSAAIISSDRATNKTLAKVLKVSHLKVERWYKEHDKPNDECKEKIRLLASHWRKFSSMTANLIKKLEFESLDQVRDIERAAKNGN
ncbi:MAG: hypothetical protein GY841_15565 [FCB group bacterium]|nr:hypothetical protein [FCB group bacterium]